MFFLDVISFAVMFFFFICRDNCGPPHILFSKKQRIKTSRFHTCDERDFFSFFSDGTVTKPAICIFSIFLSLLTGNTKFFVSGRVHPFILWHCQKYISLYRLGSIFEQRRRSLPQADK